MTEEENKAIKIVKEIWQFTDYSTDKIALKVVLDLIEKLQKENEELKKQKVEYLDKIYNKIDNLKYEYKKAEKHSDPERASFYRDLIRHFEKLLEEE